MFKHHIPSSPLSKLSEEDEVEQGGDDNMMQDSMLCPSEIDFEDKDKEAEKDDEQVDEMVDEEDDEKDDADAEDEHEKEECLFHTRTQKGKEKACFPSSDNESDEQPLDIGVQREEKLYFPSSDDGVNDGFSGFTDDADGEPHTQQHPQSTQSSDPQPKTIQPPANVNYDILKQHHTSNRHRRSPSPSSLTGTNTVKGRQSEKRHRLDPALAPEPNEGKKGEEGEVLEAVQAKQVHTILTSFRKHGIEKAASTNAAWHEVESVYYELNAQLASILEHPYHGLKLDLMLEDWTRNGMTGYTNKAATVMEQIQNEFTIILD
ncbi:hypothetical protein L210DRAFT_3509859 [Boletus edulis BED1]|uniref:Uncharacterized protein n=1 Tax=Boletus edulis BED1 TaxID=1328754 RepID=A0AAD4BDL5_BOLED|nr:hypothetical protein L210DRAFT_3509859 [Boletus edulis BED1]